MPPCLARLASARYSLSPQNVPKRTKTLHLVSLGCAKNRVDSEVMLGVARRAGYEHVADAGAAEVIVVNTCGFIGDAKRESIDVILEMAAHKQHGRCQKLVVAGCLAQRHPDELARDLPEVDHFLGSSDVLALGRVLLGRGTRIAVGDPASWLVCSSDPRVVTTRGASAYVKIAEGCNRRCSFCVIPRLRGAQRSRPVRDIVEEVRSLADQGVLEVNLVSQDTVAFGRDRGESLAALVEKVAEVSGISWVRLLYLYPETLDRRLVDLLGHHPRVLPYVDMPLQHAADAMLRRMRRGHGGARLHRVVERLRRDVPGLVLRTAFIVGHPGETAAEYGELCDFVRWARFDRVAAFVYSDEEDTASEAMGPKVPARTARARYRELMTLQQRISLEKNRELIGRELDVLVEGQSDEHEMVLMGRHAGQAPEIDGQVYLSRAEARPGTMRRVRIEQASHYDLVGTLIDDGQRPAPAAPRRVSLCVVPSSYR
jgi:ribosomal protein S12 methylthiotransferase